MVERWEAIPVSGVNDAAYYYSTYNSEDKTVKQSQKINDFGRPEPIGQESSLTTAVYAAFALVIWAMKP